MAYGLENFDLPENLHTNRAPNRYWLKRTNRRNYFRWLASHLDLPNPAEDQDPWYGLTFDQVHQPIEGFRRFGKGVYVSWNRSNSSLRGTYQLAIMDAFPEVEWGIWEFRGRSHMSRWAGFNLPHPDVEEITGDSPVIHISRLSICRGFLLELARRLSDSCPGINIPRDPSEWDEMSWRGVTSEVVHNLRPPMTSIGTFWRNGGCPVGSSLFSALSTYFDDVDFVWRRFLVGGRVTNGFGIPDAGNEEIAREEVRDLLGWIVQRVSGLVLQEDNLELLYDVGQRTISPWYGGIRGPHWNGSPQALIEFAYPEGPNGSGWDPTMFGLNRERQRLFWHHLRAQLSTEELALMDEQENQGWERSMTEFGLYPRTEMPDGHSFGGPDSHYPNADIWLDSRNLMVDVLGEDHFYPLSRSNERTEADVRIRFLQRQIQDRQRWELCWRAGDHVIAIGPELGIDDEGLAEFREALTLTIGEGPSFQALGWPDDSDPPEFE